MKIEQYFPYDKPRLHQMETICDIVNGYKSRNGYVLESPTGTGKSGIAYTAAKAIYADIGKDMTSAWKGPRIIVLTKNRGLQTQYEDSFADAAKLWSAKNYSCPYSPGDNDFYFGSPLCLGKFCKKKGECEYLHQRNKFMSSEVGVLNYHYFLSSKSIEPQIIILDEAHDIENILCGYMSILISSRTAKYISEIIESYNIQDVDKIEDMAKKILNFDDVMNSLSKDYICKYGKALTRISNIINAKIEKLKEDDLDFRKLEPFKRLGKVYNILNNLLYRFSCFDNSEVEWVICNRSNTSMEIKPIEVYESVGKLHSQFDIFMSATICHFEEFCKTININPMNFGFKSLPSTIPVTNRKVFVTTNTGSLNINNKHELLPIFVRIMDEFIDQLDINNPVRGIIHSVSYENAKIISQLSKHKGRIIVPEVAQLTELNSILSRKNNTIIVSPSILEGVDLKDDLSRFQIFPKVPYGNLGDAWTKRKMQLSSRWYQRDAALKIVQGSGRSIRSPEDWGVTLILDNNFFKLLKCDGLFPTSFLESIEYVS